MTLARRLDGAALLARVFATDVTACPRSSIVAFLAERDVTARILDRLGLGEACGFSFTST